MSSDDSPPLGQRRRPLGSAAIGIQGSSDDELPEWAATYKVETEQRAHQEMGLHAPSVTKSNFQHS